MRGFDWDEGNEKKNWIKHKVSKKEAESVFFDKGILVVGDPGHSSVETRYTAHGSTKRKRKLTIIFTIRGNKIRVISARGQSKNERLKYEQHKK